MEKNFTQYSSTVQVIERRINLYYFYYRTWYLFYSTEHRHVLLPDTALLPPWYKYKVPIAVIQHWEILEYEALQIHKCHYVLLGVL